MNRALLTGPAALACIAIATTANAQDDATQMNGQRIAVTRTIELPDQIGFAFQGYANCLNDARGTVLEDDWRRLESAETRQSMLEGCHEERERTVFLAATALERSGEIDLEARQQMIFESLTSFEEFMLAVPEPPTLPSDGEEVP